MSNGQSPNSPEASAKSAVAEKVKPSTRVNSKPLPPWHVILLDDDLHTYEYVVAMLRDLFAYARPHGWDLARAVDKQGKAVIFTTHKELAELKRDQIHAYGADQHLLTPAGPMQALIAPADVE